MHQNDIVTDISMKDICLSPGRHGHATPSGVEAERANQAPSRETFFDDACHIFYG